MTLLLWAINETVIAVNEIGYTVKKKEEEILERKSQTAG